MDALYFRVSSERQTTQNQFDDLLQVAEKDGSGRDWNRIMEMISRCVIEEHPTGANGTTRTVYRLDVRLAADLARECGTSSRAGPARSVPAGGPCSSR